MIAHMITGATDNLQYSAVDNSHGKITLKAIHYLPDGPDTNGWKKRHMTAVHSPIGPEKGLVMGISAWIDYAAWHNKNFDWEIGSEHKLGSAWFDWGCALRALINGDCGRLDYDTLKTILRDNMQKHGYDPDLAEQVDMWL